jgi:3-hydroxyisobutyrate dehydrogenase
VVGVVGLGDIGKGVASGIARAGLELAVYDVRADAAGAFADTAKVATSLPELGQLVGQGVVVLAVVTDDQVRAVIAGLLEGLRSGASIVVVSTVSIETLRQVAAAAKEVGVAVVDCGVSGGPSAAAEGALVSMVGGEDEDFERARPVLESFSSLVVRMGPLGAGLQAKLARNVVQYGSWLAAYEAQRLAEAAGIKLHKLAEVIKASDQYIGGSSRLMFRQTVAPFGPDDAEFIVDAMRAGNTLAHKDLRAALALADELGVPMPMTQLAEGEMDRVFGLSA